MGIRNTVEIICDFPGCKSGQNAPSVVAWCNEDVNSGRMPLPEEAKTFVSLELNGAKLAFCSRLHAAEFFCPDMYEIKQKGLVEFPKEKWTGVTTRSIPFVYEENPVNGQETPDECDRL
jgi:hypothetical protein